MKCGARWGSIWAACFFLAAASIATTGVGSAVVMDGSLGKAGALAGPNGTFVVGANLGEVRGGNLFQSFSQFNISSGDAVTFTGPATVHNVIARVTGGQMSTVDGTINSVRGSNFYLINPAGVVFGPDAQLDVDGLFAVSTADYLRMADGTRFPSLSTVHPLLSSAAPAAFGFLNSHPGPITITGIQTPDPSTSTSLSSNGTISIVAGNITISQQVVYADGVRSVASKGEVPLQGPGSAPAVGNAAPPPEPRGGSLTVTDSAQLQVDFALMTIDAAVVNVTGEAVIGSVIGGPGLGGVVRINASNALNVIDGGISTMSVPDQNGNPATGTSGNIRITSPKILLQGTDDPNVTTGIFTEADTKGAAGNVAVSGVSQLTILHEARLGSVTFSSGRGGNVRVSADSVTINGTGDTGFTGIASSTQNANADGDGPNLDPASFTGPAGNVYLHADHLQILNAGGVVSNSLFPRAGHGGIVNVNATNILIDGQGSGAATSIDALSGSLLPSGTGTNALDGLPGGPAGSVNIATSSLRIINGGSIRGNTTGADNAGQVRIHARDIFIDRAGSALNTGIGAQVEAGASGNGGGIRIAAGSVTAVGGGLISVSTLGSGSAGQLFLQANTLTLSTAAAVQSSAQGSGNGGNVTVDTATRLNLSGGGQITASSVQGTGGNVQVSSGESVVLAGGSITTSAAKNGGSISVSTQRDLRLTDSELTTSAAGTGGNISLSSPQFITLTRSQVETKSTTANGGNIQIDPLSLTMSGGSLISANGGHDGGNISIQADALPGVRASGPRTERNVTAFGETGTSGSVAAGVFDAQLAGSLVSLSSPLISSPGLLPQCGLTLGVNQSSFIVTGRGGSPAQPGSWQPDLNLIPRPPAEPIDPGTRKNMSDK